MKKFTLFLAILSILGLQFALAQTKTITGTVTSSEDGSTIPGVTIQLKDGSGGTTTDLDGKYSITVPAEVNALIFSFIGMKTQEVSIEGKITVDVIMETDILGLEEVIVLGYVTRGKNQITGSTVQVKGESIKDIPVVSVDQALQGKVAGLTISTSSGTPGSIQDIRIRGVGSITAGNDPLIVIDGVPMINEDFSDGTARSTLSPLAAINSNDIASMTVLKDASATSAYGARGSNGVIVITTKSGKSGKTKFDFSSTYGFQNKASNGYDVLTAAQREELYLEGIYNSFGATYGFTKEEAYDWALAEEFGGAEKLQLWIDEGRKEGNWEEELRNKNAPVTNINLSATGGDDVSSFYASLGYNKTEATVVTSDFERITGALNYKRNFAKNVLFSTNINVSNLLQQSFLEQSAYFANPHAVKYFMSPLAQPYDEDGNPNTNTSFYTTTYNPLYLARYDDTYNNLTRAINNSFLEWEIIDKLKFKTLLSMDYSLVHYKNFQNRKYGDSFQENGTSYASDRRNLNYTAQNSLDYELTLNDVHNFAFKALIEFQKNKTNWLSGYGENFPADGLTFIDNSSANQEAGSSYLEWMNLSYLGMVNYNYMGKYIADFTYRREGSSKFASDLRFGNFWSVGAAWNMSQESFLADVSFINNLRFRASYGLSGSSDIDINLYQALLAYDEKYAEQGAPYPAQLGNTALTWEKNKNYDIGIDFAVLNSKISGSFAYFNKNTYDLLQEVEITRTAGFEYVLRNSGTVVNKGFEALMNVDIVRSKDLNVSFSVNFASLDNEVTKLAKDLYGNDINIQDWNSKVQVGQPIDAWYMRKWASVDVADGRPLWYLNGEDGQVTKSYFSAEEAFQGKSPIPTYSGGFSLHVDFKGVFFDVNLAFAGGNKVFEDWSRYTHDAGRFTTDLYQGVADLMNRWQQPGDITDNPKIIHALDAHNGSRTSSRFLFDGDYARLKDVVLGYNFPSALSSRIGLGEVTVFTRGTNLYTWVKDDRLKYDPEVRADGLTRFTTPPVKSIVFGLNLKF